MVNTPRRVERITPNRSTAPDLLRPAGDPRNQEMKGNGNMYQIIFDFFATYLFDGAPSASWTIGGVSITMTQWLSHTCTIIVLALLFVVACKFVVWLTKIVGNIGR